MVDILLWLGDRLELSIPLVLALGFGAMYLGQIWRRRRRDRASIDQGDDGQLVMMEGNRVGGDVRVSQERR